MVNSCRISTPSSVIIVIDSEVTKSAMTMIYIIASSNDDGAEDDDGICDGEFEGKEYCEQIDLSFDE